MERKILNIEKFRRYLLIAVIIMVPAMNLFAARIKDIATVEGVSGVQVIGYGLVTGLNQTGDNQMTSYTVQSVSNLLKRFGLTIPQTNPRMRNVAAVMVTSTIPSFQRKGSKVDVKVSSIGDATSLQGGVLLMTPLSTADGTIIGMAQGALSVGGFDFRSLGSRLGRNFVTTGRVPNGLILEQDITSEFVQQDKIRILLRDPDFTTANNISGAITAIGGNIESVAPLDAGTVEVQLTAGLEQVDIMQTISQIETANVTSDPVARVVINERTGTIVVGGNVQLLPAVISHGNLEISIQRNVIYPQQAPFSVYPPRPAEIATITTEEELNPPRDLTIPQGATVQQMAGALTQLQVKPRDLISIFQALKEAGVLQGELIIQ